MTFRRDVSLVQEAGIELILVDVGASIEPFKPFQPLLGVAIYIGFDPDLRGTHERKGRKLHKYIVVDKAVVPDPKRQRVRFFVTKHPQCSSTLRPKFEALKHYLDCHRFEVVNEIETRATSFADVVAEIGLTRIDWLKLDTQGTDLRLLESIEPHIAEDLMAVDVEPGFDQYYEGEDTFTDLHRRMTERGFWLADLEVASGVRLPASVLEQEVGLRGKLAGYVSELALKGSPKAARARYLRTLERLELKGAGPEAYLRLWACAQFSGNYPYALHVLHACGERWPEPGRLAGLRKATIRRLRGSALRGTPRLVTKLKWRNIRRLLSANY